MRKRNVIIKALVMVLVLSLIAIFAYALDYPHNAINTIGCNNCHDVHGEDAEENLFPPWIEYNPQNIDDTRSNTLCWHCHNGMVAPYVRTHSSLTTSDKYGDWSIECRTCHNPHLQEQFRTYGEGSCLYLGESTDIQIDQPGGGKSQLTQTGAGWENDAYRGLVVIPKIAEESYGYKIESNTGDTLTVEGIIDLSKVAVGDRFAIIYGKLIKSPIYTPNSGEREVRFFKGGVLNYADGDIVYDGVCEVCHTQTTYHRNNDLGDHGHNVGVKCTNCHSHLNGFKGIGGTSGSHPTHLGAAYGPNMTCSSGNLGCHGANSPPTFADGNNFQNTTVCNTCHSPGGSYDGVDDLIIGARANWDEGVYEGNLLKSGKEKWCASCHDEIPSVIEGVSAPNIIGDEDTATPYGTGYGFYKTGHGLSTSKRYPATGGPGAGLGCQNCHDAGMPHIDGIVRSYEPDSDYLTFDPVSANYQNGFRLKDVATGYDGKYALHIPRTGHVYPPGFRADWEFALCFQCHAKDQLFNGGDPETGEGAGTNFYAKSDGDGGGNPLPTAGFYYSMHDVHTWGANGPLGPETPQYDSDFDGTADSRISCPACHNVHGSPSPAMMRHGELIGKAPAIDFQYTPEGTYPTLANSTGGKTRFIAPGPGDVSKNGICNMCHNDQMTYARTPIDTIAPEISWVDGQVDSDILTVSFSEGVYSDMGAVGDLTSSDFTLTDSDNGRAIIGVTHTAGDATAILILDSPLDSTDDIGIDTLSGATSTSIYDALGNPMDTTPVIISSGDHAPPTLSNKNPATGTINIAVDSDLTFTLSDSGSEIDWTTFSIQISGDKGYSAIYTDEDTSIVSKTGSPVSYDVTVNPDADFGSGEVITIIVNVDDLVGNSMIPPAWSFTITPGGAPATLSLHPSGVASDGGFSPINGSWATVLDSNDGDASYVNYCCGPGGQIFYVHMDDLPAGLEAATIDSITIDVYARYLDGAWPGAIPYAGNVDIGYKTGTNTVWKGNTATNTSGAYNLIMSNTYTTDSDGGPLDLTDINNLQIAVKRNTSGPPVLRVTEVYVEIAYTP